MSSAPAASLVEKLPARQTVLVTGATGFIGSRLVAGLSGAGHQVIALVRNPKLPPSIGVKLLGYVAPADLRQLAKDPGTRELIRKAALKRVLA